MSFGGLYSPDFCDRKDLGDLEHKLGRQGEGMQLYEWTWRSKLPVLDNADNGKAFHLVDKH